LQKSDNTTEHQQLTELLNNWEHNDKKTQERVLVIIWDELKKLSSIQLYQSNKGLLQTTELANETYLKLVNQRTHRWQNRAHFFALCSQLIRRIVVDHVRKRNAKKHGGDAVFVTAHESALGISAPDRFPDW